MIEERIKQIIGAQTVQILMLQQQVEDLQKRLNGTPQEDQSREGREETQG